MKMKDKNKKKININNNKPPLPKIKYSSFSNTLTKIKSSNIQSLSNAQNNSNFNQFSMIQQNLYQPKELKQKEEQKFNTKTNNKFRNLYELKMNSTNNNGKKDENKNNIYQNNFKYLLKEFGLSDYIRKFYEVGYDNHNYLKLGTLSRKSFNILLKNIHIFPGHTVKMEKLYEYIKKLNISNKNHNNNSNNNNLYKKRIFNFNSIYGVNNINDNHNHYYNYDIYDINKQSLKINKKRRNKICLSPKNRPKTSHIKDFSKPKIKIRNNYSGNKLIKKKMENYSNMTKQFPNNSLEGNTNTLIKSYLNVNHKYSLNQKLKKNQNNMNLQNKYNGNIINNINIINPNDEYNKLFNYCSNYNIENKKELEDKINQNIEKMLNYYMVQLNDKLDKSYETIEDSSLSCIVTSQINESSINKNINNNINNENRKILPNYKLPSMNYHDSLNNKNNDRNINSIIKNNLNDKNNIEENKKKEKILKEKETIKKNEIKKSKEIQKLKEEKIKEDNKKEEIKLKEEYTKDIKKFSEHETSTKSKDSKEHEVEEDENLLKNKKQNPNLNEKQQINLIKEDFSKEKIEDYINNYSSEMNIYDNLRLNKSMDYENINKDTLKFDIEFMCRCLGLALMRHIEQGKEKQHITELYFEKQNLKYSFFNSDFNKHISLLTDFFEINNSDINLGDSNKISILEKFCLENGDNDNDDIEIMKHIKKNGDEKIIQKNDIQEETFKSRKGFVDIENEIKFIGDFIYPRKKTKNYQDLSENTRKILSKDLSYIKEIDSEMNKTLNSNTMNNNSKTNISKSINNSKFNNNAINSENDKSKEQEDSKNNNENQNKIIDGDEKEEDYNYEDEFLNEYNIVDKKKMKNLMKIIKK